MSFDVLNYLKTNIGQFIERLLRSIVKHSLQNLLLDDIGILFKWFENGQIIIYNVNLDLCDLSNIPFSVNECKISEIVVDLSSFSDIMINVKGVHLVFNVCNLPRITEIETNHSNEDIKTYSDNIDNCIMRETIGLIQDLLNNLLERIHCNVEETSLTFITELGISNAPVTHKMRLHISTIKCKNLTDFNRLDIRDIDFYVCFPLRNAFLPRVSIDIDRTGNIVVDCSTSNPIQLSLCGDSYFIFSFFLQLFFENQRYISRKSFPNTNLIRSSEELTVHILRDITTNIKELTQNAKEYGTGWIHSISMSHLYFIIDLHKGSDFQDTRIEVDKISYRIYDCCISSDFSKDQIEMSIEKLLTTIGYIDKPIKLFMKRIDQMYWDLSFSVPEVHINTSQTIIDTMLIILNFNTVWNEYDLLYTIDDTIKFRTIEIHPVSLSVKYYHSPVDYRKIFKGNWKAILKLIPPCDLTLKIPKVTHTYIVGWTELFDEYLKEVIATQKFKCVKKILVGVTKRKMRQFLTI